MPSESQAQHAFMAMSRTAKGRAALRKSGKKPAPVSVGNEYLKADTGKHFKSKHVKKK